MFANLYRAMAKVGMPNPREVDRLLVWECAVLLGSDEANNPDPSDPYAHLRADLAYREALAAWQTGEGPPPDPSLKFQWDDGPSPEEQELMAVLASGSSFA